MSVLLTINGGSSSIKFAVYESADPPTALLTGEVERIGQPGTVMSAKGLGNPVDHQPMDATDQAAAADRLIDWLHDRLGDRTVAGIGHRVVHGGLHLVDHQIITEKVSEQLRQATGLDPDHLPREIGLIEAFGNRFSGVPQVACFDSAFHKDLPTVAKLLPIPRKYLDQGVRRLGFHGISYAWLMQELRRVAGNQAADGRVILAHLGSGASMAAIHRGKPIDTSMAFTPTAGIVMGTRPGDLDPGLLVYLMRSEKLSADQLDELLNKQCGMKGVSDSSSDMRDLIAARTTDARAAQAVDLFCYSARKMIGAFSAALGGVDMLIFAGGIGEHSPEARAGICMGLEYLGIEIDPESNAANRAVISAGRATVRVIETNEQAMIARIVFDINSRAR